MKPNYIVLWLCVSVLLVGCGQRAETAASSSQMQNEQANQTQDDLNLLRKQLGLRPTGGGLVLYRSRPNQDDWKLTKGGFPAKTVFKDAAGKVVSEEDYYYSGAEFTDHEDHGWERITVHYDYGTKEVYLAYTGTNTTTDAALSEFLMSLHGPSTDVAGAMAAVKSAAAGWPDAPK